MAGSRRVIDAGRLWAGGLLAGVVAAGVAVVGLLVVRGILDIPVLRRSGTELVDASTWWYAACAFLAGAVATGLLHGLLLAAPQPFRFFRWIFGLAVAIAVLVPFTTDVALASKIATAGINLAIGACIGSIVSGVGQGASRLVPRHSTAAPQPWPRESPPDLS